MPGKENARTATKEKNNCAGMFKEVQSLPPAGTARGLNLVVGPGESLIKPTQTSCRISTLSYSPTFTDPWLLFPTYDMKM